MNDHNESAIMNYDMDRLQSSWEKLSLKASEAARAASALNLYSDIVDAGLSSITFHTVYQYKVLTAHAADGLEFPVNSLIEDDPLVQEFADHVSQHALKVDPDNWRDGINTDPSSWPYSDSNRPFTITRDKGNGTLTVTVNPDFDVNSALESVLSTESMQEMAKDLVDIVNASSPLR